MMRVLDIISSERRYVNNIDYYLENEVEFLRNPIVGADFVFVHKGKMNNMGKVARYYEGNDSDISPLINVGNKNKVIPISMFDKNMNHISDYDCVLDCVKDNPDLSTSQINRVLKGIIKSHKGYIFKYKDEDIVSTS